MCRKMEQCSQVLVDFVNQPKPGLRHEVVYAVSKDGSDQSGEWYEVPYSGNFKFTNYGSDKVTLSSVGYFVTNTQIPWTT
jgi:hypothetical protein